MRKLSEKCGTSGKQLLMFIQKIKKTGITNAGSLFVYYLYAFNRVFQIELRGKGVPLVEGIKILLEELHYVVRIWKWVISTSWTSFDTKMGILYILNID